MRIRRSRLRKADRLIEQVRALACFRNHGLSRYWREFIQRPAPPSRLRPLHLERRLETVSNVFAIIGNGKTGRKFSIKISAVRASVRTMAAHSGLRISMASERLPAFTCNSTYRNSLDLPIRHRQFPNLLAARGASVRKKRCTPFDVDGLHRLRSPFHFPYASTDCRGSALAQAISCILNVQ